jgi:hypothetical protein
MNTSELNELKLIMNRLDRIENKLDRYGYKLNDHLISNSYEKGIRKGLIVALIGSGLIGGSMGSMLPIILKFLGG